MGTCMTMVDRVYAPVPANGAALNVSQVHSARRHPLIESSCSARHKGEKRIFKLLMPTNASSIFSGLTPRAQPLSRGDLCLFIFVAA